MSKDKERKLTKTKDKLWISEEGIQISNDTLLELYKVHLKEQISHLDFHFKYRNYYTTILSALLTLFVGGMLQYYKEPFAVVLPFFILFFTILLSEMGKKTIDRYYRRFLESVTILAKIQNALGLDTGIKIKSKHTQDLWTSDKQIIPDRWVDDRTGESVNKEYKRSEKFISDRMHRGDNQYAHWIFTIFEIVSGILTVSSILLLLQFHGVLNLCTLFFSS